jgi:DNA polymerase, archaea type
MPMPDTPIELWGWDTTPGIVSVWADRTGQAWIWRRDAHDAPVTCETARFRPWMLLASLEWLTHLGPLLAHESDPEGDRAQVTFRELHGPGALRYLVSATDGRALEHAVLTGIAGAFGKAVDSLHDISGDELLVLSPDEQYLVTSGRSYFRGLAFADLRRMQFDLETTGLDPASDAIFLVAIHTSDGHEQVLDVAERGLTGPAAEADLIRRLAQAIHDFDPDVIENYNLQGFDLPFLATRARLLNVPLPLGRLGNRIFERRTGRGYGPWRGAAGEADPDGEQAQPRRYIIPGRETIDVLDAVRRYDFAVRDLPNHGLKATARYFGVAPPDRTYIEGEAVFATWREDPAMVRRYALDDVRETDALARLLGGAAFALAGIAPRRYERLADAGPATGILDPLIVRAYLRAGEALPAYAPHDGTVHTGAALYLFATGVARRVVKADVSSLYPSLMREYRIGSQHDHLNVLLYLVDELVTQRLTAKARGKAAPPDSAERHSAEAVSAAMKILVNSAYGYLGAVGLTRLADVRAANEVTRRGREVLGIICRELAQRGVTLLEADTDGVYFAVPETWDEAMERRVVAEVAALLPPLVRLEFEGRYAAMLSHEPKNYALFTYDDRVILRGVAFRSIRFEPFGAAFLRKAIGCLLCGDIAGVRDTYCATLAALRKRTLDTGEVAIRVRLTKSANHYDATRAKRHEAPYEALHAAGRATWHRGDRITIYRTSAGWRMFDEHAPDLRDYDVGYYARLLRETFAARLERAFTPDDFAAIVADPDRPTLFAPPLECIHAILAATREGGIE